MLEPCIKIVVDCSQSAFSLKIRLVLISSSAIANLDVVITIRDLDETRKELCLFLFLFFLLGLTPSFLAARGLIRHSRAATLQRKIRDCSQSTLSRAHSFLTEKVAVVPGGGGAR